MTLRVVVDARVRDASVGGVQQAILGLAHGLSQLRDGDEEYVFLVFEDRDEWIAPYVDGPCRLERLPAPTSRATASVRQRLKAVPALRHAHERLAARAAQRPWTPPVSDGADFGVIFLTNEGYSSMCGHGVIALTTILLERGMVERGDALTEIVYDSPAGLIRATASVDGGRVQSVAFRNVPAFRLARLAVAKAFQGQGLGGQLLLAAGRRCLLAAEQVGGVVLVIDAKNDNVAKWYAGYGALPLEDAPLTLLLPLATIQAALDAARK